MKEGGRNRERESEGEGGSKGKRGRRTERGERRKAELEGTRVGKKVNLQTHKELSNLINKREKYLVQMRGKT